MHTVPYGLTKDLDKAILLSSRKETVQTHPPPVKEACYKLGSGAKITLIRGHFYISWQNNLNNPKPILTSTEHPLILHWANL